MKFGFKFKLMHWLACGLCLLIFVVVAVALWPQPPVSGLAISFVRFSNTPGQPQSAIFGITNLSRWQIDFIILEPQLRTNGIWSDLVVEPGPITLGLDRGRGTNITVPIPVVKGEAWRIPITWVRKPGNTEVYIRRGKNFLHALKEGSLSGWRYGWVLTSHTNFSAEMELTKPKPDDASNGNESEKAKSS